MVLSCYYPCITISQSTGSKMLETRKQQYLVRQTNFNAIPRFRILCKRPLPSSSRDASTSIQTKAVTAKFADAFQISSGIFTNPAQSISGDESQGMVFSNGERMLGSLTEVARLRPDQMVSALEECDLPSEWPPGGLFDCFLVVVLEPHLKEMRVAADATFTKAFGVFAEDSEETNEETNEESNDSREVIEASCLCYFWAFEFQASRFEVFNSLLLKKKP